MLTEQKPFSGDSLTAVMFKIVSGEVVPPSNLVPSIPQEVENTILRGLAKSSGDRFSCCKDFAEAVSRGWGAAAAVLPSSRVAPAGGQEHGSGEAPTVVQTPAAPAEGSAGDQDQLETVVQPLPARDAPTEAITGLPPLGEPGSTEAANAGAPAEASSPSMPIPESVPFGGGRRGAAETGPLVGCCGNRGSGGGRRVLLVHAKPRNSWGRILGDRGNRGARRTGPRNHPFPPPRPNPPRPSRSRPKPRAAPRSRPPRCPKLPRRRRLPRCLHPR